MKYLLSLLFLVGCDRLLTYKEILATQKHQVGETIIVHKGRYTGCSLKVESIEVRGYELAYLGKSECPIIGVSDANHTWSNK